jgi:hypothetical protein
MPSTARLWGVRWQFSSALRLIADGDGAVVLGKFSDDPKLIEQQKAIVHGGYCNRRAIKQQCSAIRRRAPD